MSRKIASKFVAAVVMLAFLTIMLSRICYAQNYEQRYLLIKEQSTYRLTLSITPSLYGYYQQKSHQLTQNNFASFVTPYSLALVAADIRSIFPGEEDFVNAVLMVVHQIPYQIVEGAKYPVETIVENQGDCDLLSYVASSLIKSQGLDVVLFYYEQESHMNIGVNLPNPPTNARTAISHVDYRGISYYVAECTGDDWLSGWRVGECPPELDGTQVTVVTLEDSEQFAPGQVSSSFGTLKSSTVTLTVSTNFVMEGSPIVLTGRISMSNPNGTVTLYATANGNWISIGEVELDSSGQFAFTWNTMVWGRYHVKASWPGDNEYAGADSGIVSIYIIPKFLVFIGGGLVVAFIIVVMLSLMYRTTHPQEI